jgi:hypothetical protein
MKLDYLLTQCDRADDCQAKVGKKIASDDFQLSFTVPGERSWGKSTVGDKSEAHRNGNSLSSS